MTFNLTLPPFRGWKSCFSRKLHCPLSPGFHCASISSQAAKSDSANDRGLFEYTSGRWIYNEERRLSERRLRFNVEELKKVAANALNRPTSDIKSFRKLAEGGFNRIFEISMIDGSSILARLPYPSTLPLRLAVASEVATLDFVRAQGVPTPRILGYSVDENAVGSEYMFMEKLPGKPIGDAWFKLSEKERLKVLLQIVEFEAKLFKAGLPASGSIYYSSDLPSSIPKVDIPNSADGLCIGPYAALRWWFGERGDLDVDRGPHDDPKLVLQAPAEKELAWICAYGRPRFPLERAYRETFEYKKQDPKEHVASLEHFLRLAPHLVPRDSKLNQPILRHPDLQPNNIFVLEDFTITGLIDWQHSVVLPTFLASGIPNSFQNYSDEESLSFVPPHLPDDFESMDDEEQAYAQEQFRRRHVHFFYLGFTQKVNEPHWDAIELETGMLRRRIFDDAGSPWEGLNTPLQVDIAHVMQNWDNIACADSDGSVPPCPIELSEEDIERRITVDDALREVDSNLEGATNIIGVSSDGWISNELYEEAKEKAKWVKEEGLESVADDPWLKEMTEKHWPFDDFNEEE